MHLQSLLRAASLSLLFLSVGCSSEQSGIHTNREAEATFGAPRQKAVAPRAEAPEPAGGRGQFPVAPEALKKEAVQRKIIQNATLDVLVADFDKATGDLEKLKDMYKGYIAKSDFSGQIGAKRVGTWIIRVPADNFHDFVKDVAALGQPQRHVTDAEDVTEEFVDLESDLKNLKEKEAKLVELMKAKAQSLTDIFAWEKEAYAVRAEIARREGRLQKLNRLTAMSTAHITLRDEKEYVPPTTPKYGSTISGTFSASVQALKDFGQFVLIVLVGLAPWLPLIVVAALLGRWAIRRNRSIGTSITPLRADVAATDLEVGPSNAENKNHGTTN